MTATTKGRFKDSTSTPSDIYSEYGLESTTSYYKIIIALRTN